MTASEIPTPENSCAYEEYDPSTLKPLNRSTYTRLMELGWSEDLFKGKSVLDIGSNAGILSLYANQLGASAVKSVEVQTPLVEYFTSVVSSHNLPIDVEQIGFNELTPEKHTADIVLFMEVLHWIVDQKGTVKDAIHKLATLTKHTLFLETPWDVNEPSIAHNGTVTHEQYNIEQIIKELQKYFETVQVERFMTYFGNMKNSKRVLIKATRRRASYAVMKDINAANSLNVSLKRGGNTVELLTSHNGPLVLKQLPYQSVIPALEVETSITLFDVLGKTDGPLLLPIQREDGGYIYRDNANEPYMLFPFVGDLGNHFQAHQNHEAVQQPLKLAVELRKALAHVPECVVAEFREKSHHITLKQREDLGDFFNALVEKQGLSAFIDEVFVTSKSTDRSHENSLVHNDMQLGNMIADENGREWIIDMDLFQSGTAYSDFICCAIYNNCSEADVAESYAQMVGINGREILRSDVHFSLKMILRWMGELNKHHQDALAELAEPTIQGIRTVLSLLERVEPDSPIAS